MCLQGVQKTFVFRKSFNIFTKGEATKRLLPFNISFSFIFTAKLSSSIITKNISSVFPICETQSTKVGSK